MKKRNHSITYVKSSQDVCRFGKIVSNLHGITKFLYVSIDRFFWFVDYVCASNFIFLSEDAENENRFYNTALWIRSIRNFVPAEAYSWAFRSFGSNKIYIEYCLFSVDARTICTYRKYLKKSIIQHRGFDQDTILNLVRRLKFLIFD